MTPEDLAERQPLISRDGRRVLVSDGRIDNRRELSGELGLAWESPQIPDSAFMLAAYERWGEDCARQLIGSFSFAIWDEERKRLLLARSPFGAKTVFYHNAGEFVAFATMPKALFALAAVPRRLNHQGIADMLVLVPPEPGASLYEGIGSLEPGHLLTADRQGCRVRAVLGARAREGAAAAERPGVRGGVHRAVRPGGGGPAAEPRTRSACCSAAASTRPRSRPRRRRCWPSGASGWPRSPAPR